MIVGVGYPVIVSLIHVDCQRELFDVIGVTVSYPLVEFIDGERFISNGTKPTLSWHTVNRQSIIRHNWTHKWPVFFASDFDCFIFYVCMAPNSSTLTGACSIRHPLASNKLDCITLHFPHSNRATQSLRPRSLKGIVAARDPNPNAAD